MNHIFEDLYVANLHSKFAQVGTGGLRPGLLMDGVSKEVTTNPSSNATMHMGYPPAQKTRSALI